jgi:hypothetical protein
MIYFSNIRSVVTYGVIFRSHSSYSSNIFQIKKIIIRAIMNSGSGFLVEDYLRQLEFFRYKNIYFPF